MKQNFFLLFLAALGVLIVMPPVGAGSDALSARDIMERNFFALKIKKVRESATMTLISDKGGLRERKMDLVGKLQANGIEYNLLIRFQFPPDIKGTSFLQIERASGEDNLWIYLPALHKSRRLVANNRKDSFFGSDFSYSDILPPKVDQYQHTLMRSEIMNEHDCYVIESVPKDEKEKNDIGYARKVSWIRKDNFVENKIEYYDVKSRLLKTQTASQHKQVDPENQRWIALQREMINHQTGHTTRLQFDNIRTDLAVSDDFFTVVTLEREWRR